MGRRGGGQGAAAWCKPRLRTRGNVAVGFNLSLCSLIKSSEFMFELKHEQHFFMAITFGGNAFRQFKASLKKNTVEPTWSLSCSWKTCTKLHSLNSHIFTLSKKVFPKFSSLCSSPSHFMPWITFVIVLSHSRFSIDFSSTLLWPLEENRFSSRSLRFIRVSFFRGLETSTPNKLLWKEIALRKLFLYHLDRRKF